MKLKVLFFGLRSCLAFLVIGNVGCQRLSAGDIRPGKVWKAGGLVFSVAFSPDGKSLTAGIGRIDQSREVGHTALGGTVSRFPGEISVWDVATGRSNYRIHGNPPTNGVRFSPDGKAFVTYGGEEKKGEGESFWNTRQTGVVKVWESQSGTEKLSLEQPRLVSCTAVSSDGRTLATGSFDNTVRLWELTTGKPRVVLLGHENTENANLVNCVAFSPDGKTLASGGYEEVVRLWDVKEKKEKATLPVAESWAPGTGVFAVAFSPDGKLLASGVDDGVKVWDVATRKLIATLQGERCSALAFRPDGDVLAWQASDNVVRLWSVASEKELAELKGHTDHVYSITFSPDGKTLVSGSADQTIRFWDVAAIMKK